jgi:hypothetical protein
VQTLLRLVCFRPPLVCFRPRRRVAAVHALCTQQFEPVHSHKFKFLTAYDSKRLAGGFAQLASVSEGVVSVSAGTALRC